ncbi:MAG: right-handed parallel beta-helix repeat-containing protein [Phycisphaerae bacterium]|nr:right-handed parallel beta-helix repeat-containing protein [Phycisphaerae bacterium]
MRFLLTWGLLMVVVPVLASGATEVPATCSAALDAAAKALAGGQLDTAAASFDAVAKDAASPAFVRGLALLGLADTAAAREDSAGAVAAWRRAAADSTIPQFFRDTAQRCIVEEERRKQGLPGRDPAAYRVRLPALPEPAVVFHVAPAAGDDGDGSRARPFRSVEKARDAVRALRRSQGSKLPRGGVKIVIAGGSYLVEHPLALASQDSGTEESPVVYEAETGQTPVFHGGVRVVGWKPVADSKQRERLDPSVRDRVLEADLKALGVADLGDATALRRRPELFVDGVPQTLARWPNEGFVKTGEILGTDTFTQWGTIQGCKDGKFRYVEDRPSRWLDEQDVRLYGYWFWDWYEEYQKVASIDANQKVFTLSSPYSNYGYRKDQRYHAVNVFREIDAPGEWYLDRAAGKAYWLPPEGVDLSKADTVLSVFDQPFVTMDNVEHVTLVGLTFQEGRGDAIHIRGGSDCLVAGCMMRRFGGDAIVVEGGQRHGVFGCTMHALGCGGAQVAGGDRKTLTRGEHFVENCTVFDISRIKRTYTPAVHFDGCGNRIAHNLFERMPSSAMRIEGNDHLVELNVVRNAVQESDDQGGIDMFGNPLYRGVVIRWNRWSDIVGGTHCGAAGIRLDDMISGIVLHGNFFERCGAELFGGVQIHGGKENLVDGNVFVDCHAGISFSRWGDKRWLESIERFLQQASEPPYSTRYPALGNLKSEADVNFISRNLFAHCDAIFLRDGGIQKSVLNAMTDRSLDPKAFSQEQSIRNDPQLRSILASPMPLDEMGPYEHPWRCVDTQ